MLTDRLSREIFLLQQKIESLEKENQEIREGVEYLVREIKQQIEKLRQVSYVKEIETIIDLQYYNKIFPNIKTLERQIGVLHKQIIELQPPEKSVYVPPVKYQTATLKEVNKILEKPERIKSHTIGFSFDHIDWLSKQNDSTQIGDRFKKQFPNEKKKSAATIRHKWYELQRKIVLTTACQSCTLKLQGSCKSEVIQGSKECKKNTDRYLIEVLRVSRSMLKRYKELAEERRKYELAKEKRTNSNDRTY